jgi:hypothetical protein
MGPPNQKSAWSGSIAGQAEYQAVRTTSVWAPRVAGIQEK